MSDNNSESTLTKNRLEALSDGIFAIAMTMMIIDLKIPDHIPLNLTAEALNTLLLEMLEPVRAYVVSFFILGIFWIRQQIQLQYVKHIDRSVIIINIFFLLLIGFVPFTVNLLKRFPDFQMPFIIYISNLILISIILTFHWIYFSKKKELSDNLLSQKKIKSFLYLSLVPLTIFLSALIISFYTLDYIFFIVYLDPVFYFFYRKFHKDV